MRLTVLFLLLVNLAFGQTEFFTADLSPALVHWKCNKKLNKCSSTIYPLHDMVRDMAIYPGSNKAFICFHGSTMMAVLNVVTGEMDSLNLPMAAQSFHIDTFSQKLWIGYDKSISDYNSGVAMINPFTAKIEATHRVGFGEHSLAFTDSLLIISSKGEGAVSVFKRFPEVKHFKDLASYEFPEWIGVDPYNKQFIVGCQLGIYDIKTLDKLETKLAETTPPTPSDYLINQKQGWFMIASESTDQFRFYQLKDGKMFATYGQTGKPSDFFQIEGQLIIRNGFKNEVNLIETESDLKQWPMKTFTVGINPIGARMHSLLPGTMMIGNTALFTSQLDQKTYLLNLKTEEVKSLPDLDGRATFGIYPIPLINQ